VPFISTTLFTGPVAKSLSDVDLSWLVGLGVVCPLYYWAAKRFLSTKTVEVSGREQEIPVVDVGL
jgi:NCS1 family nucleobase:cation symporter-1